MCALRVSSIVTNRHFWCKKPKKKEEKPEQKQTEQVGYVKLSDYKEPTTTKSLFK